MWVRADEEAGQWHVGAVGHGARHEPLQDRRPPEQVALHERQRRGPGAEVHHPGAQPGAEAVAVVRVGGVTRLGQPGWRRQVDVGRPGEQAGLRAGRRGVAGGNGEPGAAPAIVELEQRAVGRYVPSPGHALMFADDGGATCRRGSRR